MRSWALPSATCWLGTVLGVGDGGTLVDAVVGASVGNVLAGYGTRRRGWRDGNSATARWSVAQ